MAILQYFPSPDSDTFDSTFRDLLTASFPDNARIAAKLHMGEGHYHFDRDLAARCVSLAKESGMRPFLFDSPVMYAGGRHTVEGYLQRAEENGFSESTMGCPVVISDESRRVRGRHLSIGVCVDLWEADGILVLSHVKGHACTGAAGALKNLGMGGVNRATKGAMHAGSKPVLTGECDACEECAEGCPGSALTFSETVEIDLDSCWGCGRCIDVCPQQALQPNQASFDALLIDGAAGVLSRVNHVLYVNDVRKITRLCDCCRDAGPEIAPDVGVLLGTDPVAIDQASVDLAVRAAGDRVFYKAHGRDPYAHIQEAARLGLGNPDYELQRIQS